MRINSRSEDETGEFGEKLATYLTEGDVVYLQGDLGSGKTCLVRGIVNSLHGDKGERVKSPTYTLLNIYDSPSGKSGSPAVHHFDFFRIEDLRDIESLGLYDYWGRGICLVEWPREFCASLPGRRIDVIIEITGKMERSIVVNIPDNER